MGTRSRDPGLWGGLVPGGTSVTGFSAPLSSLPVFEREYGGRDEACPVALQLTLLVALVQGAGGGCLWSLLLWRRQQEIGRLEGLGWELVWCRTSLSPLEDSRVSRQGT